MRRILALLLFLTAIPAAAAAAEDTAVLWPERQREFLLDGPGLLLDRETIAELTAMPEAERQRFIDAFLAADPIPETAANELREGIRRRRGLVRREFLSFTDDRARLLFLHGEPEQRDVIECGETFHPIELWRYPGSPLELVLYRPGPERAWRLWLPLDTKRALYDDGMEYWLEQFEELKHRIIAVRFDRQMCPDVLRLDRATGIEMLNGYLPNRPSNQDLLQFLEPPADLADWARRAASTSEEPPPQTLRIDDLQVLYPDRLRQRIVTRFLLTVPSEQELGRVEEGEREELRLNLEGVVEQEGEVFDEFRVRFKIRPPAAGLDLALAFERLLRPERDFLLRFRLKDEVTGAEALMSRGFRVPAEPVPVEEPPVPDEVIVEMGEAIALEPLAGGDALFLAPPPDDVVFGTWRAEALVAGERIVEVVFLLDGQPQMRRRERPFTAELRLDRFPREQTVRAEGYDASGELVAADEVVLNQPRGRFRVRIVEPRRGEAVAGEIVAQAEVTVPDERRVEWVEFLLNDERLARLERPPWQSAVEVPPAGEIAYLTVRAALDDGRKVEEVRFLNAPRYLEEVEVQLVELLTTVTDRSRRPVPDLGRDDFEIYEDGRLQEIAKFEYVRDLPLTVGLTIDASASMLDSLVEAKKAALGFLSNVVGPGDRAFAVAFSQRPTLLMPPTDDVEAVADSLEELQSLGWTALHDALVSSLYVFRGFSGRRALVLLSDGDDTASYYPFRDALEYARRSGVVIYTVGLNVGGLKVGVRRKLAQLAEQTGGRSFLISRADELTEVYREIEKELRSQYLLAYNSDNAEGGDDFRAVAVEVKGSGLTARAPRGYYP